MASASVKTSNGRSLKDEVKILVNSLLIPHSKGLSLDRFLKEYHEVEMQHFPFRKLGFETPLEFLCSIPDVVRIIKMSSGHVILQAVANESVSHIYEMVKGQKNSHNNNHRYVTNLLRNQSVLTPSPRKIVGGSYRSTQSSSVGRPSNHLTGNDRVFANHSTTTNSQVQKKPSPPCKISDSLVYEQEIVTNLKQLMECYPSGIELRHMQELYVAQFKNPIFLSRIESGMTPIKFLENHSDLFYIWKNENQFYMVCLQEARRKREAARARDACAARMVPDKPQDAVPPSSEEPPVVKYERTAPDVRTGISGSETQPTYTLPPDGTTAAITSSNRINIPRIQRKAPSVASVSLAQSSRQGFDKELPATFGLARPQVKNVVDSSTVFIHQEFPPDLNPLEFFFIIIAEVYSPGRFYWFLSENKEAIEGLTDDMTAFYNVNHGYEMSRSEMYLGQIVAAKYTDGLFYRARITGAYRQEIQVFYIDYGSSGTVGIDQLRHLHLTFTKLPVQAFLGRVFGIRPHPDESKWTVEAGRLLLDLVKGSKLIAAAKMTEEIRMIGDQRTHGYVLSLVDTTRAEDVYISDYLLDTGFAAVDEEEVRACVHLDATPGDEPATAIPSANADSTSTASTEPTTPFPSTNVTNSAPLTTETAVGQSGSNAANPSPVQPSRSIDNTVPPSVATSVSSGSGRSAGRGRRFVKQLSLARGRKLHIIKNEGELYLPGSDMALLIHNFERQMASLKMRVDVKPIDTDTHPHIFIDCVKNDFPWVKDAEGKLLTELTLYPLRVVGPLLYLFRVRDSEVSEIIEDLLKNPDDPFFS